MTTPTQPPNPDAGPGGADRPTLDFRLGDWLVQPSLDRISRPGETHRLEPKVMDVLVLLSRQGGVVAHGEILAAVWAKKFMARTVVPRAIAELRRVLGDDAQAPRYIETIPKRGYRLIAAVLPAGGAGGDTESRAQSPRPRSRRPMTGGTVPPAPAHPRYASWLVVSASLIVCVVGLIGGVIARLGETPRLAASRLGPSARTLAVLPFHYASGDPRQEVLAAGLAEALVTNLLKAPSLQVTDLGATLRYRDTAEAPSKIARELSVDAVLEGALETASGRVRISVRLIDGASDGVMWTATYDRDLGDVAQLRDEVATMIAREVQARLRSPETVIPAADPATRLPTRLVAFR